MTKVTRKIGTGIIAFLLAAVLIAALFFVRAWPVWLCWNYVVPAIFGLPELTYWQALMLVILCHMLFGYTAYSSKEKKS